MNRKVDVTRFGTYDVHDVLGRGGMGEVRRAVDVLDGRPVALKRLIGPLADDGELRRRFTRECEALASLRSPHIVGVHRFGEHDGVQFLAMDLVHGEDLTVVLHRGPMSPAGAVDVVCRLAAALDVAHAAGVVHRDLKPANVMRTPEGQILLLDFGIAYLLDATSLTRTGRVIGTVAYMAPERFVTGAAGVPADVYALAAVFHECLTGHRPFHETSLPALQTAHLTLSPPRPSDSGAPAAFDAVIAAGMAKAPDDRPATAGALARSAVEALNATPEPDRIATVHPRAPHPPIPPIPPTVVPRTATSGAARPATSGPSPAGWRAGSVPRWWAAWMAGVLAVAVAACVLLVFGLPERPDAIQRSATAVGASPEDMALSADGSRLFVANTGVDTVSVLDTRTTEVVATVPVAPRPVAVAAAPDGLVYVVHQSAATTREPVSVIDPARSRVVRTVPMSSPRDVHVTGDGRVLVQSGSGVSGVVELTGGEPDPGTPVATAGEPRFPHLFPGAPSTASGRLYVADAIGGQLYVIEVSTRERRPVAPLPSGVPRVAVAPDESAVLVSEPRAVTVVDPRTGSQRRVELPALGAPVTIGDDSDVRVAANGLAYATTYGGVVEFDPGTGEVTRTIAGPGAHRIEISADGDTLHLLNSTDREVTTWDLT